MLDVSAVTAALEEVMAPIATVGLAFVVALVGIKVFGLLRASVGYSSKYDTDENGH